MAEPEKFVYYPMRKPQHIQPDCPVYIYAYGLAVQKGSGAAFVQVRLVNRSERSVHSVFLHIRGLDYLGKTLYELRFVPLTDCAGEPHKAFGEEQVLFLPQGTVYSLEIEIQDVLFEDGLIWRKQSRHRLLTPEQAGWKSCSCGMKNPPEADSCSYCRKRLRKFEPEFPSVIPSCEMADSLGETEVVLPPLLDPQDFDGDAAPLCDPSDTCGEGLTPHDGESEAPIIEEALEIGGETVPELCEVAREQSGESDSEEAPEAEPLPVVPEEGPDLAQLLSSFRGWMDQRGALEEKQKEPEPKNEPLTDTMNTDPVHTMNRESEEESPNDQSMSNGMMEETEQILREMQRRLLARERGEVLPSEEGNHEGEAAEDALGKEQEDKSHGILFWVFMILIMIILALVGFFGILYWKGYFG